MHRRPIRAALVLAAVLLAGPVSSPALRAASLADLGWLAGSWRGTIGEDPVEESWLPPVGGAMAGLFRWSKGGQVYLYELLSFEEADGKVVLKLKHFGPGLVGWEDKAAAVVFDLTQTGDGRAVFEKRGGDPARIVYRRTGERSMTATFEESSGGPALVFTYERL